MYKVFRTLEKMAGTEKQSTFLKQNFIANNSTYYMSKKPPKSKNIQVLTYGTLP